MQLYTVTLQLIRAVSKFGPKGELLSSEEITVSHTMHGLPWQTAQMYRDTSTPGTVQITKEAMTVNVAHERRSDRVSFNHSRTSSPAPKPAAPVKSAADKRAEALASGDLSAAISR